MFVLCVVREKIENVMQPLLAEVCWESNCILTFVHFEVKRTLRGVLIGHLESGVGNTKAKQRNGLVMCVCVEDLSDVSKTKKLFYYTLYIISVQQRNGGDRAGGKRRQLGGKGSRKSNESSEREERAMNQRTDQFIGAIMLFFAAAAAGSPRA